MHRCLALFAIPLAACADNAPGTSALVRDSAGVRIVENSEQLKKRPIWRVLPNPLVRIGAQDGDPAYQLFVARSASRLSDGTIVIANAGTFDVRFFDGNGRHIRTVGRKGRGPGEFEGLWEIARFAGDSLVVFDRQLQRLTVFDSKGEFIRTLVLHGDRVASFIGVLDEQRVLLAVQTPMFLRASGGVYRDSIAYVTQPLDGTQPDTLGWFPGTEFFQDGNGSNALMIRHPFGRTTYAMGANGRVFIGTSDTYEIMVFGPRDSLQQVIRLARPFRSVLDADIERHQKAMLSPYDGSFTIRIQGMLDAVPYPETMPAFGRFLVATSGHLWVEDYVGPPDAIGSWDSVGTWSVFAPDGVFLGQVQIPVGVSLLAVNESHVLGRWKDDLDVEFIGLYELLKAEQ